jgi:hypothetical protein
VATMGDRGTVRDTGTTLRGSALGLGARSWKYTRTVMVCPWGAGVVGAGEGVGIGVGAVTPLAAGRDASSRWASQTPLPAASAASSVMTTAMIVARRVCLFTACPLSGQQSTAVSGQRGRRLPGGRQPLLHPQATEPALADPGQGVPRSGGRSYQRPSPAGSLPGGGMSLRLRCSCVVVDVEPAPLARRDLPPDPSNDRSVGRPSRAGNLPMPRPSRQAS